MAARLRAGGRCHAAGAALLLAGGAAFAVAGPALGAPMAAGPGLLAAALAALPWREALERWDRAQGLEVLAEEWDEAAAAGPDEAGARERLLALAEAMFGRGRPPPAAVVAAEGGALGAASRRTAGR
jgi:hypothetical protein